MESCKWDFEVSIVNSLGEFPFEHRPRREHRFAIVKLRLMNLGDLPISTSRKSWELVAGGNKYPSHVGTFDKSIEYVEREVMRGQDVTTCMVFEVPLQATDYHLEYIGMDAYILEQDTSLL